MVVLLHCKLLLTLYPKKTKFKGKRRRRKRLMLPNEKSNLLGSGFVYKFSFTSYIGENRNWNTLKKRPYSVRSISTWLLSFWNEVPTVHYPKSVFLLVFIFMSFYARNHSSLENLLMHQKLLYILYDGTWCQFQKFIFFPPENCLSNGHELIFWKPLDLVLFFFCWWCE